MSPSSKLTCTCRHSEQLVGEKVDPWVSTFKELGQKPIGLISANFSNPSLIVVNVSLRKGSRNCGISASMPHLFVNVQFPGHPMSGPCSEFYTQIAGGVCRLDFAGGSAGSLIPTKLGSGYNCYRISAVGQKQTQPKAISDEERTK